MGRHGPVDRPNGAILWEGEPREPPRQYETGGSAGASPSPSTATPTLNYARGDGPLVKCDESDCRATQGFRSLDVGGIIVLWGTRGAGSASRRRFRPRVCVGQIIGRSSMEVNDEAVH